VVVVNRGDKSLTVIDAGKTGPAAGVPSPGEASVTGAEGGAAPLVEAAAPAGNSFGAVLPAVAAGAAALVIAGAAALVVVPRRRRGDSAANPATAPTAN
jgi:hypothetical protein